VVSFVTRLSKFRHIGVFYNDYYITTAFYRHVLKRDLICGNLWR